MFYHLVYILKPEVSGLLDFKKKNDRHDTIVNPHITVVFPVHSSRVSKKKLIEHITRSITNFSSFKIEVLGVEKSWDHWMFLTLGRGKKEVVSMHDALYRDILKVELRNDIDFVPHIALGFFGDNDSYNLKNPEVTKFNKDGYTAELKELNYLDINFESEVNQLTLIEIDDNLNNPKIVKNFALKSAGR